MVIADIGTSRVSVFGRDGSFIREYSAPGSGPGELRGPAATFQLGDSLLGIYNMGHRSLLLFELPAGRFVRSIRLPGYPSYSQPQVLGDSVFFGARDPATGHGVLAVSLVADDSIGSLIELPSEYSRYPETARFTSTPIALAGNTMVIGWSPFDPLWVVNRRTGVIDTVTIPHSARRGVRRAALEGSNGSFEGLLGQVSSVGEIHPLGNRRFAVVHFDKRSTDPAIRRLLSDVFVSVLDLGHDRACVDGRVAQTGDALPVVAFAGDTMFVLTQLVEDSTVTTRITSYSVETGPCLWKVPRHGAPFLEN